MRTYTSAERLKLLQKEMNILYRQLEKIHSHPGSAIAARTICGLLSRESAFESRRFMLGFSINEMLDMQKRLQDKYKDKCKDFS